MEIRYLSANTVIAINKEQILKYTPKEPVGVLSFTGLESALFRGQQLHYYAQTDDIFRIVAAIGYGVAKAHAFVNANKRTAAHVTLLTLLLNGYLLKMTTKDAVDTFKGMADNTITEDQFAAWLRVNSTEFQLDKEVLDQLIPC